MGEIEREKEIMKIEKNQLRYYSRLTDEYFLLTSNDNQTKINRIKKTLEFLELEDECFVKFKES